MLRTTRAPPTRRSGPFRRRLPRRLAAVKRTAHQTALGTPGGGGAASRTGGGKRGDPYRFVSAALNAEVPAETFEAMTCPPGVVPLRSVTAAVDPALATRLH